MSEKIKSVTASHRMNFEQWKAAAAAKLADEYGLDARSIPEEVWFRFYVTNHAPRDAAERVAVLFTEGPSPN